MTAIDTNVLIAYSSADPIASKVASIELSKASAAGPLCICGAVFFELLGDPSKSGQNLRSLFAILGISVDWTMTEADWEIAGMAYQGYVLRRRVSAGGLPRRMATDFLIGAHASARNYSLLTFDQRLLSAAFPNLRLLTL